MVLVFWNILYKVFKLHIVVFFIEYWVAYTGGKLMAEMLHLNEWDKMLNSAKSKAVYIVTWHFQQLFNLLTT
jgi:hypothetical protein